MNLLFCINGGYTGPLLDCLDSIVLHGGEKHYDVYLLSLSATHHTTETENSHSKCAELSKIYHLVVLEDGITF